MIVDVFGHLQKVLQYKRKCGDLEDNMSRVQNESERAKRNVSIHTYTVHSKF